MCPPGDTGAAGGTPKGPAMGRIGAVGRHRWRLRLVTVGGLVLLMLGVASGRARAQLYDSDGDAIFDKGTWTLNLSGGYYEDFTFASDETIGVASVGAGYFLFDDFSVNLSGDGYYFDTQVQSPFLGAGFTVLLRWHAFEFGDRCTFYVDGGAGCIWAEEEIPDFGTHFNFNPQA